MLVTAVLVLPLWSAAAAEDAPQWVPPEERFEALGVRIIDWEDFLVERLGCGVVARRMRDGVEVMLALIERGALAEDRDDCVLPLSLEAGQVSDGRYADERGGFRWPPAVEGALASGFTVNGMRYATAMAVIEISGERLDFHMAVTRRATPEQAIEALRELAWGVRPLRGYW
ncbi:hypothetical protein J2T57_001404 [Natronocella acetinitrilica]|uniref:Uncharacterized protein n=1 Tax=Natronocella acetinitrilica TaxID=414046 RepID=A0AAE3KFP8_9GAMM|nr:hypothetical protein [Natronocella acetinitrilica]MCP1674302.1 hypothetical protein [Natronocella acetinitrilica]